MNVGWIKLYKSFLNWEWYKDVNTKVLFIHILLKANYEEKKWQGKTIKRGQLITSRAHLAEETGLSEKNVRTALKHLKKTNEVAIETAKTYTLITIVNWEKYQGYMEPGGQVSGQDNGQQVANRWPLLKNNKNIRNKEYATQFTNLENVELENLYET